MRIDHPALVALMLCSFAGLALLALHPKPSLQLEGEIAMLEPAVALQRLDAAADIDFDRNLALTHAALARDAGEFQVAQNVLRRIQSKGQDSPEIEMMLADASRHSANPDAETDHIAAAYALAPSSQLRQRLGLAYRAYRMPAQERLLLLSVAGEDLTSHESARLADLLRQNRQFAQLEMLYRNRADGDGPDADTAKQRVVNFLLESGRLTEAQMLALHWFDASGRDQHILQTAIPAFVNWGALDGAMALALSALQVAPTTSYQLILVFLDGGHQGRALEFQKAFIEGARTIPDEAWPTLVDIAARTGNLAGLRMALSKTPPAALATDQLSAVLLQFLRYQGVQSLNPLAGYLRQDVLKNAPLVGAAWAASHGNQLDAAAYLIGASKRDLTDWDWQIWANVAKSLRGSPAYQMLLADAPPESRARSVLQAAFMGQPDQPD